jgi:hypothetical protein
MKCLVKVSIKDKKRYQVEKRGIDSRFRQSRKNMGRRNY